MDIFMSKHALEQACERGISISEIKNAHKSCLQKNERTMFRYNGDDKKMKKKESCLICDKGKLTLKNVPYSVYGIELGKFPAKVCNSCKEQWFDEETSRKIQEIEKKKGLFGLSKKSKISYSGNSLIVRIPESVAKFMNLKKEDEIIVHPEGKNKICVEII